jgi:hypothetical protein
MLDLEVLAHQIEFCSPFSTIVNKHKLGDLVPADNVIFQESGRSLGTMISNCFRLTPLGIMVDGHQDVFVSCLSFRQWSCRVQSDPME